MSNKQKTQRTRFKYAYHVSCCDCEKTWHFKSIFDQVVIEKIHNNDDHVVISTLGKTKCIEWCEA